MRKEANINETSGGSVTVALPILKNLADQYEHGDASLKQSRGFYLRKMFKAVSA